jgi:O-methyltransferase
LNAEFRTGKKNGDAKARQKNWNVILSHPPNQAKENISKDEKMPLKRTALSLFQKLLMSSGFFLTSTMRHQYRKLTINITDRADFVRLSSLELAAREIYLNKIPGNVAEVGVYKGDFACKINEAFPDRKLYLFDTFEGFNAEDETHDRQAGFCEHDEDFSGTSVDLVLGKMKRRENCVVRRGRFPATAEGLEDKFAFVSLDADLFLPTDAGLRWFYPRLEQGGFLFVHDFSGPGYKGIREAVTKFCGEIGRGYFPLCDAGGSAVLCK